MATSVLVAGAGPVGRFMAASQQRLGNKTRLIDKAAAPSDGWFLVLNGAPLPDRFAAIAVNGTPAGFPAGTIHIVRPDGDLAMSTTKDEEVQAYLAALLRPN